VGNRNVWLDKPKAAVVSSGLLVAAVVVVGFILALLVCSSGSSICTYTMTCSCFNTQGVSEQQSVKRGGSPVMIIIIQ
jgi:ABC-type transporter Mla subunit MlaD